MANGNGNGNGNPFYKAVKAPAIALDKTVTSMQTLGKKPLDTDAMKRAQVYWTMLGPGLITGAADDDPSGIATYSQTGAQYGFQLLWLAGFTFPLMAIVQEMCARLGLMTGRGLAGNIRINYPKWVLYTCAMGLFLANTLNIGADLGAMAKGVQLLYPQIPFFVPVVGFTLLSILLQVYMPYHKYAKVLKYLVFVLFAYIGAAILSHIDPVQLIQHTVIPSITFSKDQLFLITGILGTTISPYLFFWQTSQEIEEEIQRGKTTLRLRGGATDQEIKHMKTDVWSGMFVSNIVMYFIIAACAATLFSHGIKNITTASDAALALKPFAGEQAFFLFAVGIIGAGLLAVPILAGSAAYTVAESFMWRSGLYRKLKEAYAFYGVIIISMLIGLLINFLGIDPIKMLIYSAVFNGLVAPLILFLIVRMTSSTRVMKDRPNGFATELFGWLITYIMALSGIATIVSLFIG
jgi:NRAMP (natural resistance-associated macrophage protein)-like metal ion transporter